MEHQLKVSLNSCKQANPVAVQTAPFLSCEEINTSLIRDFVHLGIWSGLVNFKTVLQTKCTPGARLENYI